MSDKTGIEWTDATWNPVTGCSKVSPGCAHCYAETFAERWRGVRGHPYEQGFDLRLWPGRLELPLRWRKPRMVFVNSMSDLFHEQVPDDFIAEVYAVIAHAPQHTFQVLTKRPERMRDLLAGDDFPHMMARAWDRIEVRAAIAAMGAEVRAGISGFPGYYVTDRGRVLRSGCSDSCLWCEQPLPGDMIARAKFCSQRCNSKAHYEQSQGRWTPPADVAREMRPDVGEQGHRRVQLIAPDGSPHRRLVHRLVLTAFTRDAVDGEQGCHRDGDPSNNALPNLRWGSQSDNWADRIRHGNHRTHRRCPERQDQWITPDLGFAWPLVNCWAGVSIENRRFVHRADILRETPAAVRFISAEPLIGPLLLADWPERDTAPTLARKRDGWQPFWEDGYQGPELDLAGISWVICGAESGPHRRRFDLQWARDLRDACKSAGVAYFMKQLGGVRAGTKLEDLPEDLRIREYPNG